MTHFNDRFCDNANMSFYQDDIAQSVESEAAPNWQMNSEEVVDQLHLLSSVPTNWSTATPLPSHISSTIEEHISIDRNYPVLHTVSGRKSGHASLDLSHYTVNPRAAAGVRSQNFVFPNVHAGALLVHEHTIPEVWQECDEQCQEVCESPECDMPDCEASTVPCNEPSCLSDANACYDENGLCAGRLTLDEYNSASILTSIKSVSPPPTHYENPSFYNTLCPEVDCQWYNEYHPQMWDPYNNYEFEHAPQHMLSQVSSRQFDDAVGSEAYDHMWDNAPFEMEHDTTHNAKVVADSVNTPVPTLQESISGTIPSSSSSTASPETPSPVPYSKPTRQIFKSLTSRSSSPPLIAATDLSKLPAPEPLPDSNPDTTHQCFWSQAGTICGLRFEGATQLQTHLVQEHTKPLTKADGFICHWEGCKRENDKAFPQRGKLDRHLQTHTNFKSCVCHICEMPCSSAQTLESHLRTHTGEKPFACEVEGCDYRAGQASQLTMHMRAKHTHEKPLTCHICAKVFPESSNLSKHMRTHKEAQRLPCRYCGQICTRQDTLVRHYKSNHKKEWLAEQAKKSDASRVEHRRNQSKLAMQVRMAEGAEDGKVAV